MIVPFVMKTFIAMIYVWLCVVTATTFGAWLFKAPFWLSVKWKDVTKIWSILAALIWVFRQNPKGDKFTHVVESSTIYMDFWYLHSLALLQVYFHLWICEPICCFRTISRLLMMPCFSFYWISRIVAIFWNVPTLPWKIKFLVVI